MKCFKISLVAKLFACTIIPIFMIDMYVVDGINVYMNENIIAVSGEGGIEMKCSYSKEKVKTIFTVTISSRNKTANGDFVSIVTFLPDEATAINHAGENLRDRIAMTNITQESNEALFIFNEIKCSDQNQYRCKVVYLNTNNDADSDMSLPTTINVTVKPQKPHISSDTNKQNHKIGKRRILQREVLHRTSLYQTTTATDPDISSIPPNTAISERKVFHQEGDNLTFVCNGNVGRPPGNMLWQTIYTKENTSLNYANGSMETEPFYGKCSVNITSYIIIQLSAKYFNARIRCFVVSQDGNISAFDETEPLNFNFGVRNVSINKLPDKEIYDTTIGSITLTCNGDGNPKPAYAWYRKKNNNIILSTSNKYVITNVIQNNSGTYICEVSNTISGDIYNNSTSVEIVIEYINDLSEDKNNNSEMIISLWIGIGIGGIIIIAVICALAINKCHAKRKRLQKDITKNTSSSLMEHCAATNPGYTSNQETHIDCNTMDNSNCILEDEKKCKVKQEKDENEICNTANQTNNKAVSYAYVTVSPDYQTEKDTNMESQDMLKPPTIDKKNKLSTTENSCDNSPDHYASPVLGIYDELHDNRHKTDNGEKFDRMIELKRLHKERNEFIEKNTSIEHQDSTMFNCHASPLEKSKPSGYESVVIEEDLPVLSSEGSKSVHGDIEIVRQHNKEYFQHQKEEERKLNKSPISTQPVEYAQVNETTKLKNKKKQNDTDQEAVDTSAEIHKRIQVVSEERHAKSDEDDDHLDNKKIISNENSDVETNSTVKDNHTICNINSTFENASVSSKGDTIKVAMVSPTIRSLGSSENYQQNETTKAETKDRMNSSQKVDDDESYNTTRSTANSEDNKQKENINVEIQQGTNGISGRTVDNASYFDTTIHLNKQQTNGDPESSITIVQNGSYTNPAFAIKDIQNEDANSSTFRSTDGLQNNGEINQNNDTQPKNDYENVGSTDHPDTSNGDTTH